MPDYFLRTPRLGFRQWSINDLPLALDLWGDPEVSRFLGGPFSREAVEEKLTKELGYHLRRQYWGMGLAEEAGRAVVNFAFENLRAKALFAGHHPENAASKRVLEKLGFRFTHEELYPPTGLMNPSYLLTRKV